MSIPTHGPFCKTLIFQTSCWHCQQSISILKCTCGSAVLLDEAGPPWPKHSCGGIGRGAEFSGWTAVDELPVQGPSITADVMSKEFSGQREENRKVQGESTIRRVDPEGSGELSLLAVVRELNRSTKRTKDVSALPDFGKKLCGLDPRVRYWQITLVDTRARPNESYTALIPDVLARSLRTSVMVVAEIRGAISPSFGSWIVTDIKPF